MLKEATASAATLAEATDAAIAKLGAPAGADVSTELIERVEEKKKLFGLLGSTPAKYTVKAYYEEVEKPVKQEKPAKQERKSKPAKQDKPAKNEKAEKSAPAKQSAPEAPRAETKPVSASSDPALQKAEDYLKMILSSLGIEEPAVSFENSDEELKITLDCGEDYGSVIGRRGETLDAIQYLTRLVINRGTDGYKRVSLNIGDYREKREGTLRALARKNAARVKKYGRNVVLDPMNPYERRIIHTTIQEIEGVTSHSVGSDGERKVVISLEEGFKPTGSYDKGRRDNGRGRYNKGGSRQSREYKPEAASRPPRSDSSSASLYGKIEINKD